MTTAARLACATGERRFRLRGPRAFETLFKSGRRCEGPFLQLVSMPAGSGVGRAGFVISAKTLPRAVDRNRVRRQLREALRRARPAILAFDVILRLKRRCPPRAERQVGAEADDLLSTLTAEPSGHSAAR